MFLLVRNFERICLKVHLDMKMLFNDIIKIKTPNSDRMITITLMPMLMKH
jgi:hypothetical protein